MQKIERVLDYLNELIPEARVELNFSSDFELLIAAVLSPQCTDRQVNIVTKELFKVANTPEAILAMGQERLEKYIYSTGFYKNKAKNIMALCDTLVNEMQGKIPQTTDGLMRLAGVGRKVANVVAAIAFGETTFAVDTHVFRVTNRLGLVKASMPEQTEKQFVEKYGKLINSDTHHRFVLFGRYTCMAKNPKCSECKLNDICKWYIENN